jgi:hypothetical protein
MRTLKRRIPTTSPPGRLGVLDPFAYLSLEGLRQEIIAIIDHLSSPPHSLSRVHRNLPAGEAFLYQTIAQRAGEDRCDRSKKDGVTC